jgi:hypothetical protein
MAAQPNTNRDYLPVSHFYDTIFRNPAMPASPETATTSENTQAPTPPWNSSGSESTSAIPLKELQSFRSGMQEMKKKSQILADKMEKKFPFEIQELKDELHENSISNMFVHLECRVQRENWEL